MQEKCLKVALLQSDQRRSNVEKNQSRTMDTLERLDAVDIVCLPEVWSGAGPWSQALQGILSWPQRLQQ